MSLVSLDSYIHEIKEKLMLPDAFLMSRLPNRCNIELSCQTVNWCSIPDVMFANNLSWIGNELKNKGADCRKMIIYCSSANACSMIREYLILAGGDSVWSDPENRCVETRRVGYYHGHVGSDMETAMLRLFTDKDSLIRIMICTVAFGMGVEIPDVDIVVHWGPSRTLLDYWQEVGRCARDGRPGKAVLYLVPFSINSQRVESEFLELCKSFRLVYI